MNNNGLLNAAPEESARKFSKDEFSWIVKKIKKLNSLKLSTDDLILMCALNGLEIRRRDLLLTEKEIKRIRLGQEGIEAIKRILLLEDKIESLPQSIKKEQATKLSSKGGNAKAKKYPNIPKEKIREIYKSGVYEKKYYCAIAEWERLGFKNERSAKRALKGL